MLKNSSTSLSEKIWGQIVTELVSQRYLKVALACRLFGHCRQAYYQSKADIENQIHRERLMLDAVRDIRIEDPGIGCYKLWIMLTVLLEPGSCLGGTAFMHCSGNTA